MAALISMQKVFLNGEFIDKDSAKISIFDRGFIFGDGIYEVVPVINSIIVEKDGFWDRFQRNLNEISLNLPYTNDEFESILNNLIEINSLKEEINKGMIIEAKIDTTNLEYTNLKDYNYLFTLSNKDNNYTGEFTIEKEDKVFKTDYVYLDNSLYLKNEAYYYPIKWDNPYSLNPLSINYSNLNNNIEVLKNYLINNLKYSRSEKSKEESRETNLP